MWDPQRIIQGRISSGRGHRRRSALRAVLFSVVCLCGIAALSLVALISGPVPFALGAVLAVLPVPVLIAAVLALDRLEPEPTRRLVLAFGWGAGVAVLVAGVLNTAGLSLTTDLLGTREGKFVSAVVGAPIVEETLKALVIVGLLRFDRKEVDGPTDGIVYAGMVGLGFAMTENVLYYAAAAAQHGVTTLVGTFVLRGLVTPFVHPLFTSMIGMALGYAALKRSGVVRIVLPLVGLLAAMTLHGLWNAAASANLTVVGFLYVVVLVPTLLFVILVTFLDRGRVVRLISRQLPRYEQYGIVTPADISMLSKLSYRRQARFWARAHAGPTGWRAMRDYQLAATELALLEDRVERGVADPRLAGRRRDSLAWLLGQAREGFLRPAHRQHPLHPPWAGPPPR